MDAKRDGSRSKRAANGSSGKAAAEENKENRKMEAAKVKHNIVLGIGKSCCYTEIQNVKHCALHTVVRAN
jgi:hypothetical protein